MKQIFSILRRVEGGPGQRESILRLKEAGIKAKPCGSIYVGHIGLEVEGTARQVKKAEKLLFG